MNDPDDFRSVAKIIREHIVGAIGFDASPELLAVGDAAAQRIFEEYNLELADAPAYESGDINGRGWGNAEFPNVTRVEVIENSKRKVTEYHVNSVSAHLQDDGRTLKVFYRQPKDWRME